MLLDTTSSPNDSNGWPSPTKTHTHLSKDGFYYPSYQEKVDANRRHNELILRTMGLLDEPLLKSVNKRTSPTNKAKVATRKKKPRKPPNPIRRSGRLREEPAPTTRRSSSSDLSFHDDDFARGGKDFLHCGAARKKKKTNSPASFKQSSTPLTAAQRRKLSNLPDWIKGMEKYLRQEEQLSDGNYRSVMRQVEKFASGEGITYMHWKGVCFGKGEKIDLSWDFNALYNQAVDHEEEHGRDRGNGWLLRHPITKMANFQSHCLAAEGH